MLNPVPYRGQRPALLRPEVAAILTEPEPGPYGDSRTSGNGGQTTRRGIAMGWGMWVLMLVGVAAFWAVVLMGVRALFPAGGSAAEPDPRDAPRNHATPEPPPPRTDADPPTRTDSTSTSRTAPIERHP